MDSELLYLTATNTSTTQNVYGNNLLINGAMEIWQRLSGGSPTTFSISGSSYTADRWGVQTSAGGIGVSRSTIAPPGFQYSLAASVTAADTSPAATKYCGIYQIIEANNIFNTGFGTSSAQTMTLSFWVYSSLTGTYGLSVVAVGQPRSFVSSYTITTANTMQKVSITIPGDVAGTWVTSGTGGGMTVYFDLGSGSNYQSSVSNTWIPGGYHAPTGTVNWMNTLGNTFYITGVQLSYGSTTPNVFSRSAITYPAELAACERYYYRLDGTISSAGQYARMAIGLCQPTTSISVNTYFPVTMRATPTFGSLAGSAYIIYNGSTIYSVSSLSANIATQYECNFTATLTGAAGTYGGAQLCRNATTSPSWIDFTAEL
jgi:hypothetical protein